MANGRDAKTRGLLQQLIFGFFPSQAIFVAIQLGIPDLLADGPQTSEELAKATQSDPQSLYRLLRALAYLGILNEADPECFELTALGSPLRSDDPESLRPAVLLFTGERSWRAWGGLLSSVQTGEIAFDKIFGTDVWDYFAQHPELSEMFNEAMSSGTRQLAPSVIEAYDFSRFKTLVDIGGGDGTLLAAIVAATPGLRGVLFDSAAGFAEAPGRLGETGVSDRCELVEGDFFRSVPPGADAYLMKSIIHDWRDDQCVRILENIRRAMLDTGTVLILEPIVSARVDPSFTAIGMMMSDLNMMVCTGGRERTEAEFASLLGAAGLRLETVVELAPPSAVSILEAVVGERAQAPTA